MAFLKSVLGINSAKKKEEIARWQYRYHHVYNRPFNFYVCLQS